MRLRVLLCLIVTISLLASTVVSAQQPAQDESAAEQQVPSYQVTVTADRLEEPVTEKSDAITVITREEIEANQWNYVVDALRHVPGVNLVQSGSPGKIVSLFLRGASSAQVMVLIDGVPLNNPYFGGVNLEDLATDNIERIEVLKGPQSPLYGSDSIAGVVHIITRKGEGTTSFRTSLEAGSFSTFRERAAIHGNTGSLQYSLSFGRQDSEGTRDNDEFRESTFSTSGAYHVSNSTSVNWTGQVFDSNIGLPFHFLFDPVTFQNFIAPSPLQRQESLLGAFGGGITHNGGRFLNLQARLSYAYRDFFFEDPGTFFPLTENTSGVYQWTLQNDFQLSSSNTLTAGYEFEYQSVDASDSVSGEYDLTDIRNNSFFVQNKWEQERWIVTAGFRYDRYNTFGDTWNPRVSVAHRFPDNWKLRGSFGTGFRAPSAGDLGLPFYGNPDLKPEKSKSWEVGFDKYWNGNASISASWFRNDYDDLITFDPATLIAGNVADAKVQGLEVATNLQLGKWILLAAYTYLDTEDEQTGERLPRRAAHSGSFRIGYDTSNWGTTLSVLGVGKRLESDFLRTPAENVLIPSYGRIDLAGFYRITRSLQLKARIENLTDKQYQEILYYDAPGIAFFAGVQADF